MPKQHVLSFNAEPHHLEFIEKVQKDQELNDRSKAIRRILNVAIQNAIPYTITTLEGDVILHSTEPFDTEEVYNAVKRQPEGIYIVRAPGWCFGLVNYEEEVMMIADTTIENTKKNIQQALDYQQK